MNKAGLIDAFADRMRIKRKDAEHSVNALVDILSKSLVREGKVTVMGFGTFIVKARKARRGVTPVTKKEIHIPARRTAVFIPGAELKNRVQEEGNRERNIEWGIIS